MTIATIITTYRRPVLLKRAINSVLKQSYSDFELYIYDNASEDATEQIVRAIAKRDSRVKYHRHSENIGMMPNYQFALDRITAPFFSLLSDDDYLLPHFYETAFQNLQKHPEAAFSACGVLQMDTHGNLVGDPLALWGTEGLFSSEEGIVEMLKTRWRFPVPTGILFQTKLVEQSKPNFSSDLDFFWDPDYLIRIVAKHPVVITKKHCGVYLAHSESFANSFYANLVNNGEFPEKYLKATAVVMSGIEKAPIRDENIKRIAMKLFKDYVMKDSCLFINSYIKNRRFRFAHNFSARFYHYFGFSMKVFLLHFKVFVFKFLSVFIWKSNSKIALYLWKNIWPVLRILKRKIKRLIRKDSKTMNLDFLKQCHEYGQSLLDE